jgi:hypothetical protein
MIGQEPPFLETFPPGWIFPGSTAPTPTVLPDTYLQQQAIRDEPINVGALQAAQVQTVVQSAVNTVSSVVSGVGSWIQSTGQTVVLIAVLGFGAWALSSLASLRRQ